MLFENLSLAVADNDFYNHSHSGFASHGDVNDKNNYYYNKTFRKRDDRRVKINNFKGFQ